MVLLFTFLYGIRNIKECLDAMTSVNSSGVCGREAIVFSTEKTKKITVRQSNWQSCSTKFEEEPVVPPLSQILERKPKSAHGSSNSWKVHDNGCDVRLWIRC